ncbi:hypothetical protein AAZX31_03G132900 [Glycine max]|uniref:Uncharacterized protein n=4 Tax=Glycine subgen. Soja TaxID=1462606 RepID=I1JNR4_SOYBN|nr:uncharacterized protein LOC100792125 [Glycine max]XP_028225463.1 uncharacterized protein LOC114406835 [Glycine soja]KAG5072335.1 hypothetical protein JHK86_007546 [Glycine max]KAH1070114.1 hypothetical protein GYH30_007297 [Glycine max]KAH1258259.1 hypothetical protein GmHk_03G008030 [Glycine max]KAH1258260.1 hypothetical protein GmHk_03G008030 [Glycine max]KHN19867.1 hypothetical protein glysoja_033499 [Glycine soja]|eukprot:XP_003521237.1 uncharacterized protein LOC100792125 [Glycine max]
MVQSLCLMASHGYPPGLVLHPQVLGLPCSTMKGYQTFFPSPVAKADLIRYQSPCLDPSPCEESTKSQNEWFDYKKFVNVDFSVERPMLINDQANCSNAVLFGFGIVEQCSKHDEILKVLMSETAEAGIDGGNLSLLSDLMKLQLSGIDETQQPSSSLIYPTGKFNIPKHFLYFVQDSALSSKITVHPDGQMTFMGTAIELKDLLSVVAESCLSKWSRRDEKQSMLVPHFSWVNINELERSHSSTLKNQSTLTAPLKSPEKVKLKPSPKKTKKVGRERDLYKNSSHACETLLSLMVDKKRCRKTAILSLKKSSPELPELLTQFSAGIAGTGLAVLLSVMCNLACGRATFCTSSLFNTGFGLGLVWLSGVVNKLRATIVNISKNAGKLGLKEEEMMQKLDKSIRDIYYTAAALLAVVVLRLA